MQIRWNAAGSFLFSLLLTGCAQGHPEPTKAAPDCEAARNYICAQNYAPAECSLSKTEKQGREVLLTIQGSNLCVAKAKLKLEACLKGVDLEATGHSVDCH